MDADGKRRECACGSMTWLSPGDFNKGSHCLRFFRGTKSQAEEIGERECGEQARKTRRRVVALEYHASHTEVGFPVSEALFDGHSARIQIDDLLCGHWIIAGDQEIPCVFVSLASKGDKIERLFLIGLVKHLVALHLAQLDRDTAESFRHPLDIDNNVGFGSDQIGNPRCSKFTGLQQRCIEDRGKGHCSPPHLQRRRLSLHNDTTLNKQRKFFYVIPRPEGSRYNHFGRGSILTLLKIRIALICIFENSRSDTP